MKQVAALGLTAFGCGMVATLLYGWQTGVAVSVSIGVVLFVYTLTND